MDAEDVGLIVRNHIASEFLQGEDPSQITDDVKLISDGVIDSLGSLRLVAFLEERFGVKVEAHEVDVDHLDTVSSIVAMVRAKLA